MKKFKVEITETLQMTIEIEARNAAEAEALVRAEYSGGGYILDADHVMGAEFQTTEAEPERAPKSKSKRLDR